MRIYSRSNRSEHWRKRSKREKAQRAELRFTYQRAIRDFGLPVVVTFDLWSYQAMDGDNLQTAFKHLRDEVANILLPTTQGNQHRRWADDSDPRIAWKYRQFRGRQRVVIQLERMEAANDGQEI